MLLRDEQIDTAVRYCRSTNIHNSGEKQWPPRATASKRTPARLAASQKLVRAPVRVLFASSIEVSERFGKLYTVSCTVFSAAFNAEPLTNATFNA